MFRTAIRGALAAVTFALALGVVTIVVNIAPAAHATASTCGSIYGSNPADDMPTDPGQQSQPTANCPSSTPTSTPTPTPKPPAPKPPVVAPKPVVKPKPATVPVHHLVQHTVGEPPTTPVAPHRTVQPAKPHTAAQKAQPKKLAVKACPAAQVKLVPTVNASFHFPWGLVTLGMLVAAALGGLVLVRVLLATGHRWHPRLRRVVAGPDHHRLAA